MPGVHAILSASSSKRWMSCTPSARLEEKLKGRFGDRSSPFAEEGTAGHEMAEIKLLKASGRINKFVFDERIKDLKARYPSLDWADLDWATSVYEDHVMTDYLAVKNVCKDAILNVEERLDYSAWAPSGFGTGDAVIVSDSVLIVSDLKLGKGVPVSAISNPQARCYGLGAISAYGDLYGFKTVKNCIIQPRIDNISEETLSKEELLRWGDEELKPKADLAWEGKGEYNPGDHCRFCAARALCYARAAKAMSIFDTGMENPGVLPDEEIPRILEVADTAEGWIKDIREYAQNQAMKGVHWPGFKLVAGRRPPRRWVNEDAVVDQLSRAGYSDDQIYTHKLIGVGDAEKLMGKQAFRAILGDLSTQGPGKPMLVPEDDPRLSINSTEAAFADLAEEYTS